MMKSFFLFSLLSLILTSLYAQVGIGTTTPKAFFNVADGKDVLFGQDLSGAGTKLLWRAGTGVFRIGTVMGTQWDASLLGLNSFAAGHNTTANGKYSTALGLNTVASGLGAFAAGNNSVASDVESVAMGYNSQASGGTSVAIGANNMAQGSSSVALGSTNVASGISAVAIGTETQASGAGSFALGRKVSTNGKYGSFIIGDFTSNLYSNTQPYQMMMRFQYGYTLYTTAPTNQSSAIGAVLGPGQTAWQTLSDSTRKENFRPADGTSFLQRISTMRLGSWNYKGQDVKLYRHYGPMAQDFFAAFGYDELGTIGEDKSINQADFDGVNLIAIQALIKEVEQLKAENNQLRAEVRTSQQSQQSTQARLDKMEALLQAQATQAALTLKP